MRHPKNSHFLEETGSDSPQLSYPSRLYAMQHGINDLISAGDQILTLVTNLVDEFQPNDKEKLLQDLIYEIRSFENRAQLANYDQHIINIANYALCILVDEAITLTPWGKKNHWKDRSLLKCFHDGSSTNSKFLTTIENILESKLTEPIIDLLELLYLTLSLGKPKTKERDQKRLNVTIDRLYQTIERHRPIKSTKLLVGKIETIPSALSDGRRHFTVKLLLTAAILMTLTINGVCHIIIGKKVDNYLSAKYGFIIANTDSRHRHREQNVFGFAWRSIAMPKIQTSVHGLPRRSLRSLLAMTVGSLLQSNRT